MSYRVELTEGAYADLDRLTGALAARWPEGSRRIIPRFYAALPRLESFPLSCAGGLVRQPQRTIVVLITDFFEGRDERDLIAQARLLADSGIRMIGLGALGYDARPAYNKATAGKLRKVGMDILVCTPEKLAECMAEIIRG